MGVVGWPGYDRECQLRSGGGNGAGGVMSMVPEASSDGRRALEYASPRGGVPRVVVAVAIVSVVIAC